MLDITKSVCAIVVLNIFPYHFNNKTTRRKKLLCFAQISEILRVPLFPFLTFTNYSSCGIWILRSYAISFFSVSFLKLKFSWLHCLLNTTPSHQVHSKFIPTTIPCLTMLTTIVRLNGPYLCQPFASFHVAWFFTLLGFPLNIDPWD